MRLKTQAELDGIRESCRLLSAAMARIRTAVVEGATTKEIDAFGRQEIAKLGARPSFLGYLDYPAALCISVNEEVIHGIPSKRKLKSGDIVGIDCGLEFRGYYSDAAFTLPVGMISAEKEALLRTTRACLDAAIGAAVFGNRMHDISAAVFHRAREAGYGVVRDYCGHGVGLSQHEEPQVPNYVGRGPNPRLKEGMVLAIEPMINMGADDVEVLQDGWTVVAADGKPSAHFEHTVAILKDRTEVLTYWD